MNEFDVVVRLGVALIVGLCIGVERGFSHRSVSEELRPVGVRTFALLALLGAGGGLSIAFAGPWLLAAIGLGVIGFLITAYRAGLARSPDLGLTTEIASIVNFVAGALSGAGAPFAAVLMGAATLVLLHNKPALHALTDRLDRTDIDDGVKLAALAALAVPLAPDQGFGPGGAINPRELALAVVIIAGLNLAGSLAVRFWGGRSGLMAFGFLGGLVSSTGVTISAAKLAQTAPQNAGSFAAAVGLAQAVMFARTALLASTLNPSLIPALGIALTFGGVTAALMSWSLLRGGAGAVGELTPKSPNPLNSAAQFVVLAAAAMTVSALLIDWFGPWTMYASAFVAGLVDVDAATATAARLSNGAPGAYAVILALAANAASKTAIAWRLGGSDMGKRSGYILLGSAFAATAAFVGVLSVQ